MKIIFNNTSKCQSYKDLQSNILEINVLLRLQQPCNTTLPPNQLHNKHLQPHKYLKKLPQSCTPKKRDVAVRLFCEMFRVISLEIFLSAIHGTRAFWLFWFIVIEAIRKIEHYDWRLIFIMIFHVFI